MHKILCHRGRWTNSLPSKCLQSELQLSMDLLSAKEYSALQTEWMAWGLEPCLPVSQGVPTGESRLGGQKWQGGHHTPLPVPQESLFHCMWHRLESNIQWAGKSGLCYAQTSLGRGDILEKNKQTFKDIQRF